MSSSKKMLTMSSSSSRNLEGEEMQGAWLLPDDVTYLIMYKLMVFPAYLARFSAVCKRWHRLVCNAWPKLVQEHDQINTPLALVPITNRKKEKMKLLRSCQIYNLMGECALAPVNSLPCYPTEIIGSSFGWLIVQNPSSMNRSILLFNPISKSSILLPPVNSRFLLKGVLSKAPPRPEEDDQHFDIAITMEPHSYHEKGCQVARTIAFLHVEKIGKVESLEWVYDHFWSSYCSILDVNNIGGRICSLHTSGIINCCKCRSTLFADEFSTDGYWCNCSSTERGDYGGEEREDYGGERKDWKFFNTDYPISTVNLLESPSSSKPLVVFRYYDEHSSSGSSLKFKVLSLNSSSGDDEFDKTLNCWTEVRTLGKDVIFLQVSNSICIQAGSNLLPDSIYFPHRCKAQGTEFGIYNVNQDCLTHFSHPISLWINDPNLPRWPPVWLHPCYDKLLKFYSIDVQPTMLFEPQGNEVMLLMRKFKEITRLTAEVQNHATGEFKDYAEDVLNVCRRAYNITGELRSFNCILAEVARDQSRKKVREVKRKVIH